METKTGYENYEMQLTRIIKAPRKLVWKAWIDPKQLKQWWGPKGFTNPRCEWEAKPNGKIYIDMKGPDGTVYPMDGSFIEIKEPDRIVFISGALDGSGKRIFDVHTTVVFTEEGNTTKLQLTAKVQNSQPGAEQYLKGMNEGWNQSIDKLVELVGTGNREIITARLINASRELVWEAFTNPNHVIHWWGPNGFTNTIYEMEVKPGGRWRFMMHGPNGMDFPNLIVFEEVVKPERLVFRHSSEDENDPNMFRNTIIFEKVGNKTNITMTAVFPTAEERDRVVNQFGAIEGGKQTLAKWEEYILKNLV